jgi:hypothetical protein
LSAVAIACWALSACASPDSGERAGEVAVALKRGAAARTSARHLLLRVSYENGRFVVRRAREVDAPLAPLRGPPRHGADRLLYRVVAADGAVLEIGSIPDPRLLRHEAAASSGHGFEHHGSVKRDEAEFTLRVSQPPGRVTIEFGESLAAAPGVTNAARPLGVLVLEDGQP